MQENELLRNEGIDVQPLLLSNMSIQDDGLGAKLAIGIGTTWSLKGYQQTREVIAGFRPDLVHFHNTFPQLSPSAYYACRNAGVPVVQTLHNYRLLCAAATFLRDGRVCEDCVPMRFYNSVKYRCYRNSSLASLAIAGMQYVHHTVGTYRHTVDRYIALTQFAKKKFVEGGLPESRITVKSNTLQETPEPGKGGFEVLFVGRLSPEKGIDVLLRAWREHGLQYPLRIVGDGPLRNTVEQAVRDNAYIRYTGALAPDKCLQVIAKSAVMVLPSLWYEGFPMTVLESYAVGTPVVASKIGSLSELVREGETGWTFPAGDSFSLAESLTAALENPQRLKTMRGRCREEFMSRYAPERNVSELLYIYQDVIESRRN
ncbi:MAG: glycosyltransferase [Chromatiaceae bacterium]|nr:glycosyltransferase [Chromatiaceae bacterium]